MVSPSSFLRFSQAASSDWSLSPLESVYQGMAGALFLFQPYLTKILRSDMTKVKSSTYNDLAVVLMSIRPFNFTYFTNHGVNKDGRYMEAI